MASPPQRAAIREANLPFVHGYVSLFSGPPQVIASAVATSCIDPFDNAKEKGKAYPILYAVAFLKMMPTKMLEKEMQVPPVSLRVPMNTLNRRMLEIVCGDLNLIGAKRKKKETSLITLFNFSERV